MKQSYRIFSIVSVLAMVFTTFASSSPVLARSPRSAHAASADFVPGEVVIGFSGGQAMGASAQAFALAGSVNAQVADVQGNLALLSFAPDADVNSLVSQLQGQAGVAFAEPNFVYSIPEQHMASIGASHVQPNYVLRRAPLAAQTKGAHPVSISAPTHGKNTVAVAIANLQAMKTLKGKMITSTYPSDKYLWWGGWDFVGASIAWPNATPSAGICEIDTGVDYLHPDLMGNIIKGYDFVNGDIDPMDDNGHGTHVAGIMVAKKNNLIGIAGVSTGKVVAVKALDAQGNGTNFDVAAAITYCANRIDVKVINMSLGGGGPSTAIYNALDHAVNAVAIKKLVVAAAGNDGTDEEFYPAFYGNNNINGSAACTGACPLYPALTGKVLAVAASGYDDGSSFLDYSCQGATYDGSSHVYTNFGSWINVVAPGTYIESTTPYDKPFWKNTNEFVDTRYDSLSGTSMAAPYVAAAAARRWGYKPTESNTQIGSDVTFTGAPIGIDFLFLSYASSFEVNATGACWDASMAGKHFANVAALLDRGAIEGDAYDASAGTPLNGAILSVYKYPATLVGSSVISAFTSTDIFDYDPTRVYSYYSSLTTVLNVLADYSLSNNFYGKVSKSGYTATPQAAFGGNTTIRPGGYAYMGQANVPPKSANFDVVTAWSWGLLPDGTNLDSYVWLPSTPNVSDSSQPSGFAVGRDADSTFLYSHGDSTGAMTGFPFARLKHEGGVIDSFYVEDITLSNRKAHNMLSANAALPYYPGTYTVGVTDYGQIYDDDADGCGDNYGSTYDPGYDPTTDSDCAADTADGGTGTAGIPLLGNVLNPIVILWKDGLIKASDPNSTCFDHSWQPFTFSSGLSGGMTMPFPNFSNVCGTTNSSIAPY